MTELTYLFATLAVLVGMITSISIWAPRQLWLKLGALGTAGLVLPVAYAGFAHLLSMPKPVSFEWWHARADEATVLASTLREDEGIYLWLQLSEAPSPGRLGISDGATTLQSWPSPLNSRWTP